MVEHQAIAHGGGGGERTPEFNFRVVKQCKSSLERPVREAVRIVMRGNVLNRKGMYNTDQNLYYPLDYLAGTLCVK